MTTPGARCHYLETEAETVPAATRAAAEAAAAFCSADLPMVGPVSVRWLRACSEAEARRAPASLAVHAADEPVTGFADPAHRGTVFVLADLGPVETVRAVAHECRHLCDFRLFGSADGYPDRSRYEDKARAYERRVVRVLAAHARETGLATLADHITAARSA